MSGAKKFVFCEGPGDEMVIRSLARDLGLDFSVEKYGGKGNLANFLQELSRRPEFAQQQVGALAILRDADESSATAFASVRDTLRQHNFAAPEANETFTESAIRVGVFIVGVDGKGMIENLCLKSVADQPEFHCVDDYFRCIAQHSARKDFKSKAKVRVWMASHVDWEYHVGKAAEEGYWPWASPAFDALKSFLRALYYEP